MTCISVSGGWKRLTCLVPIISSEFQVAMKRAVRIKDEGKIVLTRMPPCLPTTRKPIRYCYTFIVTSVYANITIHPREDTMAEAASSDI
jgi:hypothetical protein